MRRRFLNVAAVILMLMTIFQTGVGAVSFKDMPNDWSRDALDNALDKGLLNGFEDGTIRPNANLTRAEFAQVMDNILNYREPEDSEELVEEKVLEINQEVLEDNREVIVEQEVQEEEVLEDNREVIVEQEVQEEQEVLEDKEEILEEEEEVPAGLEIELEVLRLVNIERKKQGIKPLKLGEDLIKVAKLKSEDMADNEYFSHTSPTYGSPFDMMKRSNIIYKIAGENITMGHTSPEDVMDGWMNSPSHKASILDPRFGTLGVGYVSGNGTRYWTQMFTD